MARALKQDVTQRLAKYRAMRNFKRTPEPSGKKAAKRGHSFVVQKHAARALHYDFRLELDGVLLSWAVPKGPSMRAGDRRLAMRTEEHPLEYGDFEGIIPQGEYGGGSVIVWDRGTWTPEGDPRESLAKGRLTFTLHGEKLSGLWHWVRTRGLGRSARESWLLFKSRDPNASDEDIVTSEPNSVLSGRSIDEVGEAPQRIWHSDRGPHMRLTNLKKVLYKEQGVTKGQILAYYLAVADYMLPLVADRPLALLRCPDGHHKECFFQKHAMNVSHAIGRVEVPEERVVTEHTYIKDLESVFALVQLGVLEIHTWGCHVDNIERPDQIVFDLDPDPALPWERVTEDALHLRGFLGDLGLQSFVKTTGGKGLHVVLPVERRIGWDELKAFSLNVVERLAEAEPDRYVTNPLKRVRKGKVFLDYLRNGRGATSVAPYSTRARTGATVSTPITWEELEDGVDPKAFTLLTMPKRLDAFGSHAPWHDYYRVKQSITAAMRKQVSG